MPKFACIPKNAGNRFFYSRVLFFFAIVLSLSASSIAQTVDYNLPQNWMCHPVLKSTDIARHQNLTLTVRNPDFSVKEVIPYARYNDTLVDIFYVYPTIDMDFGHLGNTTMDGIDTLKAKFVYSQQVGIFGQFGRVFVPYYRQAKISVFIDTIVSDSNKLANCMEFAYNDIDSAFSHYMKFYNKGHKIILMGHSQGSDHIMFLLRKKFDNNPVLQSQLIVALCAGEPNYALKNGSRTGGVLQNIKAFPPKDSVPESGCLINWRTWNKHYEAEGLADVSFFYNQCFVDKGLIYKTYDSKSHQDANYDFGYTTTPKPIARYISIDNSFIKYVGFDNMFRAEIRQIDSVPGSSHLWIDTIFTPNDQRIIDTFPPYLDSVLYTAIPISPKKGNYHVWDWQFVQWDILNMLPELIAMTNPVTSIPEIDKPENSVIIYPNPTNGIVHVTYGNQKIKGIHLYNSHGVFIQEYFTNDFSVSNLTSGIYFIIVQTDKSFFTNKLVKQ